MNVRSVVVLAIILVLLTIVYFVANREEPQPREESAAPRLWSVETDDLERLQISIPGEDMGEAWVKRDDSRWYFDGPDGPRVDMERWGGAVPLLVSSPRANRAIVRDAPEGTLEEYGLRSPSLLIEMQVTGGRTISVRVGDRNPAGESYYVSLSESRDVYTIDGTWVNFLGQLVLEPPYPQ